MSQELVVAQGQLPEELLEQLSQEGGIIAKRALAVFEQIRLVQFGGRALYEVVDEEGFAYFTMLRREDFERVAYRVLGGVSRTVVGDLFAYMVNVAPDVSDRGHLIAFGDMVWDTKELEFTSLFSASEVVWRSPITPTPSEEVPDYLRSLAPTYVEDILQSMAPLVMHTKPDGVIWWVGGGANGKSSLMDAIYRIFPHQLASLTIKRLTDERDTPMLNGRLANVVRESSEGRIDDTQVYKSIGTHEDFQVHKFHSQESLTIRGNMHHIFSANAIPVFNDKGHSARRRTHVIPFNEVFSSNPLFEEETFTPQLLGAVVTWLLKTAKTLAEQGYQYRFSAVTTSAKGEYDSEANNAEEYARELVELGVAGFESFAPVKLDYENWCARNGWVPLGINNLRRAVQGVGFERLSYRNSQGKVGKQYRLGSVDPDKIVPFPLSKPGFYTVSGFVSAKSLQNLAKEQGVLEEW